MSSDWQPYGVGHIKNATISPGEVSAITLGNDSYNMVPITVKWLAIDNSDNSGSVDFILSSGLILSVPPATAKVFDVGFMRGGTLENDQPFDINITYLDSRISEGIALSFSASMLSPKTIDYALLAHFNESGERMIGDSRIVPPLSYTVTAGGKFGNCLAVAANTTFVIGVQEPFSVGTVTAGSIIGQYTIDFWLKLSGPLQSGIYNRIFSLSPSTVAYLEFRIYSATTLEVRIYWGGSSILAVNVVVGAGAANYFDTFRHVAVETKATNATSHITNVYLDGVLVATTGAAIATGVKCYDVVLGAATNGTLTKYIDELRIVRYPAYNGSTFTPPTTPYI